jgi:hypothetical protein
LHHSGILVRYGMAMEDRLAIPLLEANANGQAAVDAPEFLRNGERVANRDRLDRNVVDREEL